jgi:hypothetical protein
MYSNKIVMMSLKIQMPACLLRAFVVGLIPTPLSFGEGLNKGRITYNGFSA